MKKAAAKRPLQGPVITESREIEKDSKESQRKEISELVIRLSAFNSIPPIKGFRSAVIQSLLQQPKPKAWHESLFLLARYRSQLTREPDWTQLQIEIGLKPDRELFELWYFAAPESYKAGHSEQHLWEQFQELCLAVRIPAGRKFLKFAYDASLERTNRPLKTFLNEHKTVGPLGHRLAQWCYQLSQMTPNKDGIFYVSTRKVMDIMDLGNPAVSFHLIKSLVGTGVLVEVEKGNQHKATRYRLLHVEFEKDSKATHPNSSKQSSLPFGRTAGLSKGSTI